MSLLKSVDALSKAAGQSVNDETQGLNAPKTGEVYVCSLHWRVHWRFEELYHMDGQVPPLPPIPPPLATAELEIDKVRISGFLTYSSSRTVCFRQLNSTTDTTGG